MGDYGSPSYSLDVDLGPVVTLTAQGAGTVNSTDQRGVGYLGVRLILNVSAQTGTPTVAITLQGKDPVSGNYYNILAVAAQTTAANTPLCIELYPGDATISTSPLWTQGGNLPNTWRAVATVAGTTPSVTATIGATLLQ